MKKIKIKIKGDFDDQDVVNPMNDGLNKKLGEGLSGIKINKLTGLFGEEKEQKMNGGKYKLKLKIK
jgi:hypothetical protein